jgi:hypothetical protein
MVKPERLTKTQTIKFSFLRRLKQAYNLGEIITAGNTDYYGFEVGPGEMRLQLIDTLINRSKLLSCLVTPALLQTVKSNGDKVFDAKVKEVRKSRSRPAMLAVLRPLVKSLSVDELRKCYEVMTVAFFEYLACASDTELLSVLTDFDQIAASLGLLLKSKLTSLEKVYDINCSQSPGVLLPFTASVNRSQREAKHWEMFQNAFKEATTREQASRADITRRAIIIQCKAVKGNLTYEFTPRLLEDKTNAEINCLDNENACQRVIASQLFKYKRLKGFKRGKRGYVGTVIYLPSTLTCPPGTTLLTDTGFVKAVQPFSIEKAKGTQA